MRWLRSATSRARLHPPEWQRLTLESALQQLWDISGIPEKYQVSLHIQPLPREPELEVKVLMYRAAQEALSNPGMREPPASKCLWKPPPAR